MLLKKSVFYKQSAVKITKLTGSMQIISSKAKIIYGGLSFNCINVSSLMCQGP